MEIKDLLAKIAEYDEMEAPDGMNIVEDKVDEVKEEDIKDLANKDEMEAADGMNLLEDEKAIEISDEVAADIERENETAENKRKWRIYAKAYTALEELSNFLEDECVDPMLGDLDEETKEFNNKINELTQEIYSRSLAFEG